MNVTLRPEDRAAVDLLLDGSLSAGDGLGFAQADSVNQERVQFAQRVLGLLREMPDADPPENLVARTMQYVAQTVRAEPGELREGHGMIMSPQPHA